MLELTKFSSDKILAAIERRRSDLTGEAEGIPIQVPEWEAFIAADQSRNTLDFELEPVRSPSGFENLFDKVVLAKRLRVVTAVTGFTRIDSADELRDEAGEGQEVPIAPIARGSMTWAPAFEMRGEGVFIAFSEHAIERWRSRCSGRIASFEKATTAAFASWRQARGPDHCLQMLATFCCTALRMR